MEFKLVLLLIALGFTSCQSTEEQNVDRLEKAPNSSSKLAITYQVNLETTALIFNLSEAGNFQFGNNPEPRSMLARALTERFSDFRDHEAVQMVNYLVNEDFVDLYDILLSLYSTDLPEFMQYAKYPSIYYENDSLTPEEVQAVFDEFNRLVRTFYEDAGLESFFAQEGKPLYDKLMSEVNSIAPDDRYVELMEDYYGIQRGSYTIVVSACSFNGIGRSKTILTDDAINIYQFVASNPADESDQIDLNDLESFTIGYTDQDYFREIAIHELGHSFFHEVLREDPDIIQNLDALEYLFTDSLETAMNAQGYTDWRMCFEEHLVRLGEVKIAELLGKDEFATTYLEECISKRGFIYMNILSNILGEYEENRARYPTIADFMPTLLEKLKEKCPNNDS
jgi:hypothetical protein